MPKVSIVILNWNGSNFLQQFLPALISHTTIPDAEIIVADNASTDNSIEMLRQNFPSVKTILLDKNYGFAGGYNKALAQLNSEYFVILNSDVEVTKGWLEPLIEFLSQHPEVAAVMPTIRSYHKRNFFEHAGASGGFIDYLGYPFCRGRIFDSLEEDKGQYSSPTEVFWTTGACMVVRASIFKQLGGFDEIFFAHMEEIDLCWRMLWKGYNLYCIPQSIVYHVGGGALPSNNPFKIYLNFRNNLYLLYKNLDQQHLWKVIFMRILLDYIAAGVFLLKGNIAFVISVFKAHFHFYGSLHKLSIYRKKNDYLKQKFPAFPLVYNKSIVWQYYICKRKLYSQLFGRYHR